MIPVLIPQGGRHLCCMSSQGSAQAGVVNCRQPGEMFFSVLLKISVFFKVFFTH